MRTHSILVSLAASAAACTIELTEAPSTGADCTPADATDDLLARCGRCEVDAECESGVCLEAAGRCAAPGRIIHVTYFAGADVGACTVDAPCRTLQYALRRVTQARDVIRLEGEQLVTAASVVIDRPVAIDSSGTVIAKPAGIPTFVVAPHAGIVTLGGLALRGIAGAGDPAITVERGSTLRIAGSLLDTAAIDVDGGILELRDAQAATSLETAPAVRCSRGTVRVRNASFWQTTIEAADCNLHVSQSRFDELASGSISARGGIAIVENNLIIQAFELADTMYLTGMAPGSTVRFNTFVNTSGVDSDGVALYCDDTLDVTSNIFAYRSKHPLGPPRFRCPASFSLFDSVTDPEQAQGEGNLIADATTFFIDRTAGDFHLACASPAKAAAEPGLAVREDFDGKPRSAPRGARADMGAFEAP
jgi:hypothetical protein